MGLFNIFVVILVCATIVTAEEWVKVWADEFNGTELDDKNWVYDHECQSQWGEWKDELQCYTNHRHENVRVQNGTLIIEARVEHFTDTKGLTKNYTSGRIKTKGKHSWTFGKYEIKAKLPKGIHLWPAFWMMPEVDKFGYWPTSGEIDIMEARGQMVHTLLGTIHYGDVHKASGSGEKVFNNIDFTHDFHLYTFEWSANEMIWSIDNKPYHNETLMRSFWSGHGKNPYKKDGQPFDQPFYFLINLAVGGGMFNPPSWFGRLTVDIAKHWPKPTMEIDFIRVYQLK